MGEKRQNSSQTHVHTYSHTLVTYRTDLLLVEVGASDEVVEIPESSAGSPAAGIP